MTSAGNAQEFARPLVQASFQGGDPSIKLYLTVAQDVLLRLRFRDGGAQFPQSREVAVQEFLRIELPAPSFVFCLLRGAQVLSQYHPSMQGLPLLVCL